MDRGAWRATVYRGSQESDTTKRLSSEVRREGREPLPDHAGESPLLSRSGGDDGDLSLPLGLALGSPIFPSGCEGKLGVALE